MSCGSPAVPSTVLNVTVTSSCPMSKIPEALTETHTSTVVMSPVLFPGSVILMVLTFCSETCAPVKING